MNAPEGTCAACGQPLRPVSRSCTCDHGETGHDINSKGDRTRCLHYSTAGRCPCDIFTPADGT